MCPWETPGFVLLPVVEERKEKKFKDMFKDRLSSTKKSFKERFRNSVPHTVTPRLLRKPP